MTFLLIHCIFSLIFVSNIFQFAKGERIIPKYWDTKNHKAKASKDFKRYPEFNHYLPILKSEILGIHRKLVNNRLNPSPKEVKVYYEPN